MYFSLLNGKIEQINVLILTIITDIKLRLHLYLKYGIYNMLPWLLGTAWVIL